METDFSKCLMETGFIIKASLQSAQNYLLKSIA